MAAAGCSELMVFVLLIESLMPPAQSTVMILRMHGMDEEAGDMSSALFLTNMVSAVPITLGIIWAAGQTGVLK